MSRLEELAVGDVITARISGLAPFGAFARIADDADGLIPGASGLAIDDQVRVRVLELDLERQRAALTLL
jgi:predicted RNA-binding protein with RPS1 domain